MNENKKITKWIVAFVTAILVLLLGCIAAVVTVDPFFQYHKPLENFPYKVDNQLSNNAGMAKTFDYDSILTGSSMVSNFDLSSFATKLGTDTIKVNYNGAYPKDISNILEYVFNNHDDLKNVYFGMDIYSYNSPTEDVKYPFPEYLYDDNKINDISYVLNKDVLVDYIIDPLRFPGKRTDLSRVYIMDYEEYQYSESEVMSHYEMPDMYKMSDEEKDEKLCAFAENLEKNLLPYIEAHPQTQFTIFFPPYSVLYWHTRGTEGWLSLMMQEYRNCAKRLTAYPNVRVFNFSDAWEYTTDLNNYVDYIHQHERVNEYILDCFKSGEHELTDNIDESIDAMTEYIKNYDYGRFGLNSPWPE